MLKPREGGPTFPLRHRAYRGTWAIVWGALGVWTPTPLFRWRAFLARVFGAQLHATAKIYPHVRIWDPSNLEMDKYACIARGVNCYSIAPIRLGAYALVSQNAHLCTGTHDISLEEFPLRSAPIHIEENAWVAADAFIGPGVSVGAKAVVGARSVVFRSVEPMTVVVGNPAKFLKRRPGEISQ